MTDLKPCAHCGSPAEMDTRRAFMPMIGDNMEDGVAIYCTGCNCDFMFCRSDLRPMDTKDIIELATEQWNRRVDPVRDDLLKSLKEIMEVLRVHAPGTKLNNHQFDALGIKAYAAIAKAERP